MQSGQISTPISTPKSLIEHNTTYTTIKSHLNITSLSELQNVPYPDLLAAYTKADPGAAIGPSFLLDGHLLSEDWKNSSFKGPVMIGHTGNEEAVLQSVCTRFPRQTPPPTLSTLIATLSPILSPAILESILAAYSINETLETAEIIDRMLKLVADIVFCKPAQDHAAQWKAKGNAVQQYSFEQHQPFEGIYKGKAAHSLDLPYLHGKPEIFSKTADPEGEVKMQRAMQDAWVNFAYGEEGWGESRLVRRFGPGEVVDEKLEVVVNKWNRGEAWKNWEGLVAGQFDALIGLTALFVGGFIGFEVLS